MIRTRCTNAVALAASALLSLSLAGCYAELDGEAFGEGQVEGDAHAETYYGSSQSVSLEYTAGMAVRIESHLGSVHVVRGETDKVEVTFTPFVNDTLDDDATAQAHIDQELDLVAQCGDDVLITAARETGASAELGADIEVRLPAGFSGDFVLDQVDGAVEVDLRGTSVASTTVETTGHGDIQIEGAAGALAVAAAFGSVDIGVESWSSHDGYVHVSEAGNIVVEVAAGANGSIGASAQGGSIIEPNPVPAGWSKSEDCDTTSGTYYLGAATGGLVDVWTHSGNITLSAKAEVRVEASIDL